MPKRRRKAQPKKPPKRKRRRKPACEGPDPLWSQLVKQRAGWKCEHCGATDKLLNAHHMIPKERKFFRHDPDNGVCLCVSCHLFSSDFSAHLTPWAFYEWAKEAIPARYAKFCKNRYQLFPGVKIDYDKVAAELKRQLEGGDG